MSFPHSSDDKFNPFFSGQQLSLVFVVVVFSDVNVNTILETLDKGITLTSYVEPDGVAVVFLLVRVWGETPPSSSRSVVIFLFAADFPFTKGGWESFKGG